MAQIREVFLTGRGVLSPAGTNVSANWASLVAGARCLTSHRGAPVGRICAGAEQELGVLASEKEWRSQDRAVLLGVLAAREAVAEAAADPAEWLVLLGSSRGATGRLEESMTDFRASGRAGVTASPATTAGAFPAAVARDLGCNQLSLFISAACTTGLHALGVGYRLLQAGQARGALVGAAEAAITDFTLAMFRSAKVYARRCLEPFPALPLHPDRNGMVLGEGAACLALEVEPTRPPALGRVVGYGAATERATLTGISDEGRVIRQAIDRALADAELAPRDIDLVVGHGASTEKGDVAESRALAGVFGEALPPCVYHKWLTGHVLGASAALSAALALEHLRTGLVPPHPYFRPGITGLLPGLASGHRLARSRHALVLAMGFGGNAGALVLASP